MTKSIRIRLGHFLYNAGILGLWRVLDMKSDHSLFESHGNELFLEPEAINGFEKLYTESLIDQFGERTRCKGLIKTYQNLYSKDPASDEWDDFCKSLQETMGRASYNSAYEIIKAAGDDEDIKSLVAEMKSQRKEPKLRSETVDRIMAYIEQNKDVLMLKDIAYTCIQPFWTGVAFLNSQKNKVDMVESYKEFFVDGILDFIENSKKIRNLRCSECNIPIQVGEGSAFSWLNDMGVDYARKPSSFWQSNVDLLMCPICKLVYSCVPLGFTQINGEGLFINCNSSVDELIRQNNVIINSLDVFENVSQAVSYARMEIARLFTQMELTQSYDLIPQNIQIIRRIRKTDGSSNYEYRLEILSREKIAVLRGCSGSFEALLKAGSMTKARKAQGGKDIRVRIYDEAVGNLLGGKSQYSLIYELLESSWRDGRFAWPVWHLLRIEAFIKGGNRMDEALMKKVNSMRYKGEAIRERFIKEMGGEDKAENRIRSYAYYLLSALNGRDVQRFLDTIIRMYIGIGEGVPTYFAQGIADEELFLQLGYAYVLGLKGEKRGTTSNDESK